MTGEFINSFGLVLDIVGFTLISKFAILAPEIEYLKEKDRLNEFQNISNELERNQLLMKLIGKRWKGFEKNAKWNRIGVLFIVFGFVLQILSNYFETIANQISTVIVKTSISRLVENHLWVFIVLWLFAVLLLLMYFSKIVTEYRKNLIFQILFYGSILSIISTPIYPALNSYNVLGLDVSAYWVTGSLGLSLILMSCLRKVLKSK